MTKAVHEKNVFNLAYGSRQFEYVTIKAGSMEQAGAVTESLHADAQEDLSVNGRLS